MIRLLCKSDLLQGNKLLLFAKDIEKPNFVHTSSILSSKTQHEITGKRIYEGPLTAKVKIVKLFSLGSSVAGIIAQPLIFKELSSFENTALLVSISSIIGFFTFVTPVLFHLLTKKYVTEMYYDSKKDEYTAVTISFLLRKKLNKFRIEDVVVPDLPGMFSTMTVNGKGLFIEAEHFSAPIHYAKIMGYDKPMDFKLGNVEESSESK